MTSESLTPAVIAAALLSIVLEWFPGVASWFAGLTPARRAGINALLVALISVVAVLGNCYWWGDVCPEKWTATLMEIFIAFLVAAGVQQGVHRLAKKPD